MSKKKPFPLRTIHMDFHTGPQIPDVGVDFDAEAFAKTCAEAHIDLVTVFAKCHHGHLYYDTDRPERHPGLARDLDLMGEQIEALHRHGIAAPIYVSVQCDEYAANLHPEWQIVSPEGKIGRRDRFKPGWQIMDMTSPYQDYLADQLDEMLQKYGPVDGVFMDMCWDQVSVSRWAQEAMRKRDYDPTVAADRAKYAHELAHKYMARYSKLVRQSKGGGGFGIWYNSRPKTALGYEKKFIGHAEIECLPTGAWGYTYFPYVARFVRPLGLDTLTHTGRFHTAWGDFGGLKPEAALKYECCSALAQSISCGVGDQLHPRGVLDKAAYDEIGRVYGYIEKCEPYGAGAKHLSQVAVIIDPAAGDKPGPVGKGFVRALQETRQQFDFVAINGELKGYELVVVPENVTINRKLKKTLSAFVKKGGAMLVSGAAALDDKGKPAMKELGVKTHGDSPYTATYLRPGKKLASAVVDLDHVMYERGVRMTPDKKAGAKDLCRVVEPYFERDYTHFVSHRQTPADKVSRYSAIAQCGRVITFAHPIFTAFGAHGSLPYRRLIGACIERLLPEPLVRDCGPAHLEATVVRKGKRTVVHLLSYLPCRRTDKLDIVEDPFPIVDMPLWVKLPKKPKRAFLAPAETELECDYENGYAHVRVTEMDGHTMVVFE